MLPLYVTDNTLLSSWIFEAAKYVSRCLVPTKIVSRFSKNSEYIESLEKYVLGTRHILIYLSGSNTQLHGIVFPVAKWSGW